MYGYIYKTTCLINNLIYVGKHVSSKFRYNSYLGSGSKLKLAIKQFGRENFICELLEECDTKDTLLAREEYWINALNARDPNVGYNILKAGALATTGFKKMRCSGETIVVAEDKIAEFEKLGWTVTRPGRTASECDKNYYLTHRENIINRVKNYQKNNKDKIKQYKKDWFAKNKDKCYATKHEWELAHKEEIRLYKLEYQRKYRLNPVNRKKAIEASIKSKQRKK